MSRRTTSLLSRVTSLRSVLMVSFWSGDRSAVRRRAVSRPEGHHQNAAQGGHPAQQRGGPAGQADPPAEQAPRPGEGEHGEHQGDRQEAVQRVPSAPSGGEDTGRQRPGPGLAVAQYPHLPMEPKGLAGQLPGGLPDALRALLLPVEALVQLEDLLVPPDHLVVEPGDLLAQRSDGVLLVWRPLGGAPPSGLQTRRTPSERCARRSPGSTTRWSGGTSRSSS